jgi:hypothetical protein
LVNKEKCLTQNKYLNSNFEPKMAKNVLEKPFPEKYKVEERLEGAAPLNIRATP